MEDRFNLCLEKLNALGKRIDALGSPPRRLCCCIPDQAHLDMRCQNDAEWIIEHGPTPDDYTESCTEHVGIMLTDAVEHRIYRIAHDGDGQAVKGDGRKMTKRATIKFRSANAVIYLQDFSVFEGIPSGVRFDVEILSPREGEQHGDRVKLTAPGYGYPTPHYGNGAIYVSRGSQG